MPETISMPTNETAPAAPVLDFVWLELTNRCNLQCLHCYAESSPYSTTNDLLDESRYAGLVSEAYDLGCRQVQFIGGEPTLNKSLPSLIAHASNCGYQFIEVFSNLVGLSESLLNVFLEHRVAVATSVYASTPEVHDLITRTSGSHKRTIHNIRRVLDSGLHLRVGVIVMEENKTVIDSTFAFLRDLGVTDIGLDHVRGFGRGQLQDACSMDNLCGNCAGNILAIGPDGVVAPCIMSKNWSVGSVLKTSLKQIVLSDGLSMARQRIAQATSAKPSAAPCYPECAPFHPMCGPNCVPNQNCQPALGKGGCNPNQYCKPTKK